MTKTTAVLLAATLALAGCAPRAFNLDDKRVRRCTEAGLPIIVIDTAVFCNPAETTP